MGALFISLLTLVLILISAFVILLVLMQRTSQSGGMGAALGGGAAESAFGSDTNTVLTKATIYSIIAFFIVSLGLFLIYQARAADRMEPVDAKELIQAEPTPTIEEVPETTQEDLLTAPLEAVTDEAEATVENVDESLESVEIPEVSSDSPVPVEATE